MKKERRIIHQVWVEMEKSPKGIYIGKAKKLVNTNRWNDTTLMVTPAANMEDLSYVSVIKKVNNDGQ